MSRLRVPVSVVRRGAHLHGGLGGELVLDELEFAAYAGGGHDEVDLRFGEGAGVGVGDAAQRQLGGVAFEFHPEAQRARRPGGRGDRYRADEEGRTRPDFLLDAPVLGVEEAGVDRVAAVDVEAQYLDVDVGTATPAVLLGLACAKASKSKKAKSTPQNDTGNEAVISPIAPRSSRVEWALKSMPTANGLLFQPFSKSSSKLAFCCGGVNHGTSVISRARVLSLRFLKRCTPCSHSPIRADVLVLKSSAKVCGPTVANTLFSASTSGAGMQTSR